MTRLEEINQKMLEEFKTNNIEDTLINRHDFLTGLRDAWMEEESSSVEKSLYILTVNMELIHLRLRIRSPEIWN